MALTETVQKCPSGHILEPKNCKSQSTCSRCKGLVYGTRYRCEACDYDLHDSCMLTSVTTSHPFFKNEIFVFLKHLPRNLGRRRCDACVQEICGFVYHCYDKGWDLHPSCLNLPPKLYADLLEFQLQKKVKSKCIRCNKKTLKGSVSGVRGWSYESKCKKYHLHVYCAMSVLD